MPLACVPAVVACLAGATNVSTAYFVSYDGSDFPENVGWRRHFGNENGPLQGGAERTIEDGVLVLDGRRNDQIFDFYEIDRLIDPGPGETFVAEWRCRVDETDTWPYPDPGVVIARDNPPGHIAFEIASNEVYIWAREEPGAPIEPGVYHVYRVESQNMVSFTLAIDGVPVYAGNFDSVSLLHSYVAFGDDVQGLRSLSRWDWFRFGTVPEPGSLCILTFVGGPVIRRLLRDAPRILKRRRKVGV